MAGPAENPADRPGGGAVPADDRPDHPAEGAVRPGVVLAAHRDWIDGDWRYGGWAFEKSRRMGRSRVLHCSCDCPARDRTG